MEIERFLLCFHLDWSPCYFSSSSLSPSVLILSHSEGPQWSVPPVVLGKPPRLAKYSMSILGSMDYSLYLRKLAPKIYLQVRSRSRMTSWIFQVLENSFTEQKILVLHFSWIENLLTLFITMWKSVWKHFQMTLRRIKLSFLFWVLKGELFKVTPLM